LFPLAINPLPLKKELKTEEWKKIVVKSNIDIPIVSKSKKVNSQLNSRIEIDV
jgi:hypothetical protein